MGHVVANQAITPSASIFTLRFPCYPGIQPAQLAVFCVRFSWPETPAGEVVSHKRKKKRLKNHQIALHKRSLEPSGMNILREYVRKNFTFNIVLESKGL